MQHPGVLLEQILKEKTLTQKQFAVLLWKKVSEVNELIKGKRNITIQRDRLLHQVLQTPQKYRVLLQIDYDYNLLLSQNNSLHVLKEEVITSSWSFTDPLLQIKDQDVLSVPQPESKDLPKPEIIQEKLKIFRNF